jgi:hypothetical protein
MPLDTWGVNINVIESYPKGWLVEVPPWGSSMGISDIVRVRLNTAVMVTGFITEPEQVGETVRLFIDAERLTTGYFDLDYVVTQLGSVPEDSPVTPVYIKVETPAGDSEPLMEIPEPIRLGGVDADTLEVPITIKAYQDIAEGDRIFLSWGGWFIEDPVPVVSKEQAEDPEHNPIVVVVDKELIDNAGDRTEGGGLPVAFFIRDVVNNRSKWSETIPIIVDTGSSRLLAPVIEESLQNVLDMDDLPNPDIVTGQVYAVGSGFAVNDEIEMRLKGITDDDVVVDKTYPLKRIESINNVIDIPLPSADFRLLVNTRILLSYRVIKADGSAALLSKSQFIDVIGEATRLHAPIALDAIAGTLNPDLPRTRIEIPWDETMEENQVIDLQWLGTRADQQIYFPPFELRLISHGEAVAKESIILNVDGEHLRAIEGGTLDLFYLLLRDTDSREVITRQSLHADLLNIGEPRAELREPLVEGEQGGVLDPADVPTGTRLIVRKYPGQIRGDEVNYVWDGSKTELKTDYVTLNSITEKIDVPFDIDFDLIKDNEGGTVKASYWVKRAAGGISPSDVLTLRIGEGGTQPELLPPIDDTDGVVSNGELDLSLLQGGFEIQVLPYDDMDVGDNVAILWHADNGSPDHTDDKDVSGNGKDKPVPFTIPRNVLERSLDADVTITYTVVYFEGGDADSEEYNLRVVQQQAPRLPVPVIVEAHGTDILDPADALNGATVRIGTEARLKVGDAVTLYWKGRPGDGTVTKPLVPVTANDRELDIPIDYRTVIANDGYSVELEYTVTRANGDTEGPAFAEYDVRSQIGSGTLKVMGARGIRGGYRASNSSRLISAFNSSTGQPLRAEWQYQGDGGWTSGTTWHDSHPEKLLRVRSSDDLVTLNSGNIIGNGIDTTVTGDAAFVAHRDFGDVVGWGNSAYGAAIPPTIITMDDIVEVSCTRSAYAGRRTNGHVVVWGVSAEGGLMSGVSPLDFVEVVGNGVAFAGIKVDGTVKAWGVAAKGGTVPAPIDGYRDIDHVVAAGEAFAALRGTGYIATWGTATLGGELPDELAGLNDFAEIIGSFGAFAAWRSNKRLVAWGSATYGGEVPADIAAMTNIIELSCANARAFVARRETGHVVAWGDAGYGGTVPDLIAGLDDIVTVCSTWQSFAAMRGNGHVVAWGGTAATGGVVPDVIAGLDDIVQIVGSSKAFAALRKNGTVVAWGDATVGGDTAPVIGQLTNVQAIYENTHGFTALTSDGRVVTWGVPAGGGDSSGVQDRLEGKVSYRATAGSRGLALSATRWIAANTTLRLRAL